MIVMKKADRKTIRLISLCLALCLIAGIFAGGCAKKGGSSKNVAVDEANFEDAFGK